MDGDGQTERITLEDGRASILDDGLPAWSSPPDWEVRGAQTADLDRDGREEAALLVWRPFAPWPVDAWLPHGGRIGGFHDAENQSCHIILVGWAGEEYRELWAGSAMAEPVLAFFAADWDADGREELAAVEAAYDRPSQGRAVALWEWNGFGFSLIGRMDADIGKAVFEADESGRPSLLFDPSGGVSDSRR